MTSRITRRHELFAVLFLVAAPVVGFTSGAAAAGVWMAASLLSAVCGYLHEILTILARREMRRELSR